MSVRAAMQQYIKDNPGKPLRDIVAAVGVTGRDNITTASAQLHQLTKRGKLRAVLPPGRVRGALYYPTATTGVDGRVPSPEEAARRQQARARRHAEAQAASRSRRLTAAQRNAFYKSFDTPATPTPAQQPSVARRRDAPPPVWHGAAPQTVDDFIAQGGQIERLAPHACSGKNGLRFDHSDNTIPTGKRRPALRRRGTISI